MDDQALKRFVDKLSARPQKSLGFAQSIHLARKCEQDPKTYPCEPHFIVRKLITLKKIKMN